MIETLLPFLLACYLIWLFAIALQKLQEPNNGKPPWHRPPKHTTDPRSQVITPLTRAPLPNPPKTDVVKPPPPPKIRLQPKQQPKPSSQISPEKKRQLLRLVNHDPQIADRLIQHAKQKHPHQSEQWIWDKVIFDLERDRR